jgi:hypothetical protein
VEPAVMEVSGEMQQLAEVDFILLVDFPALFE